MIVLAAAVSWISVACSSWAKQVYQALDASFFAPFILLVDPLMKHHATMMQ
jgi:hypothetical protein